MWFLALAFCLRGEAQILFTRDWGTVPELGAGWDPKTRSWSTAVLPADLHIKTGDGASKQVACMESQNPDEITAWLQGSNVFFSFEDLQHVGTLLSRRQAPMVFCYGVTTYDLAWIERLDWKEKEALDRLPPEIVVAQRRQNLTVLAWELGQTKAEIWVISTLPASLLDAGLSQLSQDLRIPDVLSQLRAWALNPKGDQVCWLQTMSRDLVQSQKGWVGLPIRIGPMFPSI